MHIGYKVSKDERDAVIHIDLEDVKRSWSFYINMES